MKVITVRQPWAFALVTGMKDIENRSWGTAYRGPVAIHAGMNVDAEAVYPQSFTVPPRDTLPRGVIVGVVDLIDVTRDSTSAWAIDGLFHWHLANPRTWPAHQNLEHVGTLGLRDLPDDIEQIITALAKGHQ